MSRTDLCMARSGAITKQKPVHRSQQHVATDLTGVVTQPLEDHHGVTASAGDLAVLWGVEHGQEASGHGSL